MPIRSRQTTLIAALLLALAARTADAADLRVGTQNTPVIDPHFMLQDSNIAYNQHIYGALVDFDEHGRMLPDLATSWTSDGGNIWRFTLRRGVTFHDGTPFTADDVVFSFKRVPNVPNNPAPYSGQLLGVEDVRKVDDFTVDIVTEGYLPLLPPQIAKLAIVSKRAAEGKSTEDFNQGTAAIGTGPYRFVSVQGRERLLLERFEQYWGKKPDWEHVEFRVLPNDSARTAALLAGDVDLIEFVPLQDAARLKATPGIALHSGGSPRVMYLGLNLDPKVTGPDGKNPMLDPRVRLAVSLAMNREGLVRSTLQGFGRVASQIGVPGMNGYLDDLQPDAYDPERARKLLAEAGYGGGLTTGVLCPNGRYIADAQVCQAVGQMLARVGIKAGVEAVPAAVFFGRVRTGANAAPIFLGAWSNVIGDAGYTLNNMFHSIDRERKMGSTNRSLMSDPELDREIDAALTEHDPAKRLALLRAAGRRAADARVLLPLFTAPVVLASKASITYDVGDSGSSEMTSAMRAHPAK
ncbi:MAG TPA: ABC transporter substrate-binding protein [Acetobacteraceae bacterium]|nr:ABC transporter substrate-binding protein [Acetobacteraceae bacterium]